MAKTRLDIKNRIYEYLPQVNKTSKDTLVNDSVNLALEELSSRHDWTFLKSITPDTATMTAGQYFCDLTSFSTIGTSASNFKDITAMFLMKSGSEDYNVIRFLDDKEFQHRYGYVDYASRSRGDPVHYTRLADRLIFNCPLNETKEIRAWWNKYHSPMTADTGAGSALEFQTRDEMTAMQAIVYLSIMELKASLVGVEFPQELKAPDQLAERFILKLIARDKSIANEDFTELLGVGERSCGENRSDNPYGWV